MTVNITAVPGSRSAEKAQLYVRTGVELKAGVAYRVSFSLSAVQAQEEYVVCFGGGEVECAYGRLDKRSVAASGIDRVDYQVTPEKENGELILQLSLGKLNKGAKVTVSNVKVQKTVYAPTGAPITGSFNSVSSDKAGEAASWTVNLTSDSESATLDVTKGSTGAPANWMAKLLIHTGVDYDSGKAYRLKFDIEAEETQREFVVVAQGVPDNVDVRGTWGLSLAAGEKKTISTRPLPGSKGSGELAWALELGNLDGESNTFTVSNIVVEEVSIEPVLLSSRTEGTVTNDTKTC